MIPQSILANSPQADAQLFYWNTSTNWQIWKKPLGFKMAYMLCIGSGSSGGGGNGTGGFGGGGGGSAGIVTLLIPLDLLPDRLYIQVAKGALAAAASANGNIGAKSYVSLAANTTAANLYLVSQTNDPTGGDGTVGTASGGLGATVSTASQAVLSTLGIWRAVIGQSGASGGVGFAGGNAVAFSSTALSGGGGGGGVAAGGNVNLNAITPVITGGTNAGTAGNSGITLFKPFVSVGGAGGGGSSVGAPVGQGGKGGIGCGSGGGAASSTSVGSASGAGGDGFVAIWCF